MLIRAFLFAECCAFRKTAYNSQIGSTSGASCCLRGRVRMPHPLQVDGNFRTSRGSHSSRIPSRAKFARFARAVVPSCAIRIHGSQFAHALRGSHSSRIPSCAIRTVRTRSRSKLRGSHTRFAVRTLALTVAAQKFTCWRSLLTSDSHTRFTADAFFTQMLYTDYR